jgi:hypothetical protein
MEDILHVAVGKLEPDQLGSPRRRIGRRIRRRIRNRCLGGDRSRRGRGWDRPPRRRHCDRWVTFDRRRFGCTECLRHSVRHARFTGPVCDRLHLSKTQSGCGHQQHRAGEKSMHGSTYERRCYQIENSGSMCFAHPTLEKPSTRTRRRGR